MKPRTLKGQFVASSNPLKASVFMRFNVEVRYTPIGYKSTSVTYKDK